MASKLLIVKRLREASVKAAARVSAAKGDLKAAKSQLKKARKVFKAEKKAAKQLRRKLKQAVAATFVRRPKPAASDKAKAPVAKVATSPQSTVAPKSPPAHKKRKSAARPAAKSRKKAAPDTMRSAAEVAKSVIERLHPPAPPPPTPPLSAPVTVLVPDVELNELRPVPVPGIER